MFEAIKHYRIGPGKDLNTEIERVKKEMKRDGIVSYRKLTDKDREIIKQYCNENGYRILD
jgi:hypothetical protein